MVNCFFDFLVAFGRERDDFTGTGLHFLDIRDRFFVAQHGIRIAVVFGGDDDDRKILVNQRIGAVLHLASGVALGVDIGNFLQLQRALKSNGVVNATGQEEEVLGAGILFGQVFAFFVARQQAFELSRKLYQLLNQMLGLLFGRNTAQFAQIHRY